jgi:FkbM family methyltransferase
MKILYGYDNNNYIDITADVFKKCLRDDGIYIPSGDGNRCDIIGYDPYPNILKHIKIIDNSGIPHIFTFTKEINIRIYPISKQLSENKNPKICWEHVGKHINDPIMRLNALQKQFNLAIFEHGGFEAEYPEQLMIMRYVNENDKVLEIGGQVGRTSHIIQTIVNSPKQHVIMECDPKTAQKLRVNLNFNTYTDAIIETAGLSHVKLYMTGGGVDPPRHFEKDIPSDAVEIPTITYSELCKKYDIDFNVLVADCEGSLYYIFKEDPNMLDNIHTVIMENDYYDVNHKQVVDTILTSKGFNIIYKEKGVPCASWSPCYEYFYEVWKKE